MSASRSISFLHFLRPTPCATFPAFPTLRIAYCSRTFSQHPASPITAFFKSRSCISPICFSRSLHVSPPYLFQGKQLEKDKPEALTEGESQSGHKKQQSSSENVSELPKTSIFQRFKQMYKDYWYVLIPVHVVTSVFWAGGFYFAVKNGLDVVALLESLGVGEKIINPLRNSSVGYYALTYALYKVASPARYAVTIGGTTVSINYLTRWGYIRPVPSSEKLQVLYQARKDDFSVKRENIRKKLRQHRADLKKRMNFGKKRVKK